MTCGNYLPTTHPNYRLESLMRRLIRALAAAVCPLCGWWAEAGHQCHPADR